MGNQTDLKYTQLKASLMLRLDWMNEISERMEQRREWNEERND